MTHIDLCFFILVFALHWKTIVIDIWKDRNNSLSLINSSLEITSDIRLKFSLLNEFKRQLCDKIGMTPPRLIVINAGEINALAIKFMKHEAIAFDIEMIESFSLPALKGILAHEINHLKSNHNAKNLLSDYLLRLVPGLIFFELFYFNQDSITAIQGILGVVFINEMMNIVGPMITRFMSRIHELDCDIFAAQSVGKDSYFEMVNQLLASEPTVKLTKNPLIKMITLIFDSHPSWNKRINAVNKKVS